MKKDLGAKEILFPMPVLIIGTYDENGNPDAMNAAWGGISDTKEIGICLSPEHKTVKNFLKTKAFTVSVGTKDTVVACDYFGIASGNKEADKIKKAGFHAVKSEKVNAPLFEELPFTLECQLISYDAASSHLFGKIVNIVADDSVMTDGVVDIKKLNPIAFNSADHSYVVLGEKVADAFKAGAALK